MEDVMEMDVYKLLDILDEADEKEVKRAYRKKALSCHPDKNPDNPEAAKLFHQLTKALEILVDAKARSAYDLVRKAKKAAVIRSQKLDNKSKKFKEDLEAREQAAAEEAQKTKSAVKDLKREIERLRAEGLKIVEEERELLRQQIIKEREESNSQASSVAAIAPRLKIRWKVMKADATNAGYSENKLMTILKQFGNVDALVISKKKRGSAMVEFSSLAAARAAVASNVGGLDSLLKFSWIGQAPEEEKTSNATTPIPHVSKNLPFEEYEKLVLNNLLEAQRRKQPCQTTAIDDETSSTEDTFAKQFLRSSSTFGGPMPFNAMPSRDYEDITVMKLRQAEERKRLIEQMMKEDEGIS